LNKIHNIDFVAGSTKYIKNKSVQLIIADSPYFEVKGEFDFNWSSFEDYLKDVEKWAIECKRILADNGTLYWYGHAKKIAYTQIILDKYFKLENSLVWEKAECQTKKGIELFRSFASVTERILMYSNEIEMTGREFIEKEYIAPRNPFSIYLKDEFKKANITNIEIAKLFPSRNGGLTGCVSNWLNGDNVITKEQYLTIRKHLNFVYLRKEYEDLRKEYEDLRKEYEDLRRPFNNFLKLTDVLKFSQETHITKNYDHDTKKPEKLTRALIKTSSRKGDLICIPFSGSGTEVVMAIKEDRNFIAFDIEKKYVDMGTERGEKEQIQKQQLTLF